MQEPQHASLEQYKDSADYRKIYAQIESLGLVEHIKHLDEFGYVVIPPELVAPAAFQQRLLQAGLDAHERRTGEKVPLEDVATTRLAKDGPGYGHGDVLLDEPVFQEAVLNPTVLALGKYLCGNRMVLSDVLLSIKQQDTTLTHPLHTDQHGTPPPLPPYAQVANVTWVHTPYTKENGPVAIVPKSHLKSRYPSVEEGNFLRPDAPVKAIPVEAAAGSLIVWHGATWHGAYPRHAPGLRLNLIIVFTRVYMKTMRDFRNTVPQEVLDRHPPEFARLIGANSLYPLDACAKEAQADANIYMISAGYNPWS